MTTLGDDMPPSPPRSPAGDKLVPSTEIGHIAQLQTSSGSVLPAPAEEYEYHTYDDPSLYHTTGPERYYQQESYAQYRQRYQTPPPYAEHVMRTRSGRAVDLPASPPRRAQSPRKPRPKNRNGKGGKPGGPVIDQPLSRLTKDYSIPVRDMEAWVTRSAEDRHREAEKKNGYISRPMNSFMLYRSAYAERVKQFCKENNHQVVSQVTGASWPMEPDSVRKEYERLAILERDNHAAAHPEYKFAPNKNGKKRGRDDDDDSDGEWGGSTRTKRSRTATSSRYGDSRSNTGTPFDDRHYAPQYSPGPSYTQYNPSSYQQHYPGRIAPVYHQATYTEYMQPRVTQYAPGIEDIRYERFQQPMMSQQEPAPVIGMPSIDSNSLLGPETLAVGFDIVDPRLGGSYDAPGGYGTAQPVAYHPGQVTLTDGWSTAPYAGAAFDQELDSLNYH